MKILLCLIFILIGAFSVSLFFELTQKNRLKIKNKWLKMFIPINNQTNLAYAKNYISYMDNVLANCDLEGYLNFINIQYEAYLDSNIDKSFQQYLDIKYPVKKK